jgi:hypothetical protein
MVLGNKRVINAAIETITGIRYALIESDHSLNIRHVRAPVRVQF